MSELRLCSRREADDWIARGWVLVNGQSATLGQQVAPHDTITVQQEATRQQQQQVTVLLNKPVGYVSGQAEDGYTPAVVLFEPGTRWAGDRAPGSFAPAQRRGLAPAGRLDIDSTGLLVLTQDGRVARRLIGDDSDVDKEYLVRVQYNPEGRGRRYNSDGGGRYNFDARGRQPWDGGARDGGAQDGGAWDGGARDGGARDGGAFDDGMWDGGARAAQQQDEQYSSDGRVNPRQDGSGARGVQQQDVQRLVPPDRIELLRYGLVLDGVRLREAQVEWQNPEQLRFVLREGRKRQIRRMCEAVGLTVVGLKRVRIGAVRLGQLPVGQWRYLAADEQF